MSDPRTLHREAMEYAERALLARRTGDEAAALDLFRTAFERESAAAEFFEDDFKFEPMRSVLHRSAAALALDHGNYRAAERLLAMALIGEPPPTIADEIRDLVEMVNFHRHWGLRGIRLNPHEFQLTIQGLGTGFGIAPADQFVGRVRDLETMIYRTAERKLRQPYRDSGPRKKSFGDLRLFVSVPRAASYAVTLRIGTSDQMELPGMPGGDFSAELMREVLDCIALVDQRELDALEERIGDESYFHNFLGLARKIAPDGEVVRAVGFTAAAGGIERRVTLTTPRARIKPPLRNLPEAVALEVEEDVDAELLVEVRGILLEADALSAEHGLIQLKTADGQIETITVPRGMMRDIVKPLFEEEVVVAGVRSDGSIALRTIEQAEE